MGKSVTVGEAICVGVIVAVAVGEGVIVWVADGVTAVVTVGTAVSVFSQVGVSVGNGMVAVTGTVGDGVDDVLVGVIVIVGVSTANSIGKIESRMMGSGGPPGWQAVQSVGIALPRM